MRIKAFKNSLGWLSTLAMVIALAACGGKGGGGGTVGYTIGGSVSGLNDGNTLVLQNNAGDDLTISTNGSFHFATPLAVDADYTVTVKTQPAGQFCTVENYIGTAIADVSDVAVTCGIAYSIGGSISGLNSGSTVVLQNNAGDDLPLSDNGNFSFAAFVASGSTYSVTVKTQPDGQTCTVAKGTGTANATVSDVAVTCANLSTSKLPHSGITTSQCFATGSDDLVDCSSAGALALNSFQDGMLSPINPMSYSAVDSPAGGTYPLTECVKDNVTGLVWEGKEDSGTRTGDNGYTYFDSTTSPQIWNQFLHIFENPTQAQIDAITNIVGYMNYVNSKALCGYTDWRIPTVDELQSIVDYGKAATPAINIDFFPNTPNLSSYWASSTKWTADSTQSWFVSGASGSSGGVSRHLTQQVRLVRGNQ
jgi:Protein of unknown function (DUF1566)